MPSNKTKMYRRISLVRVGCDCWTKIHSSWTTVKNKIKVPFSFFLSLFLLFLKTNLSILYGGSVVTVPADRLSLDRSPNIGPLVSRWELEEFENCRNKSFRTSKILTLLYPQFSNLLISQRDMNGPRLGALSDNRWSGVVHYYSRIIISFRLCFGRLVILAPPQGRLGCSWNLSWRRRTRAWHRNAGQTWRSQRQCRQHRER